MKKGTGKKLFQVIEQTHVPDALYISQGPDGLIDFRSYIQSDWNTYLESMSRDGEWADHVVLVAMAHMLRRDILVLTSSPEGTGDKVVQWIVGDVNFKGTPIRLGHVWEQHYLSLGMSSKVLLNASNWDNFLFKLHAISVASASCLK